MMTAFAMPAVAGVPSGIIPHHCQQILHSDLFLPCYLNDSSNAAIAQSIEWTFPSLSDPNFSTLSWPQWPASAQAQLVQVFQDTVAWYNGGMISYPGTLPPDPPPSADVADYVGGTIPFPTLDYKVAFQIYLQHVAMSLAAEVYQWVPWGLHGYDANTLFTLLSPIREFSDCNAEYSNAFCPSDEATPGNAINTFKFLKTNGLIAPTTIDTIGNVLDWARSHLWHFNGLWTPQNYYYNWQYWGYPPVSRVIAGTPNTDPQYGGYYSTPEHWTAGCYGTSSFLVWVLKVVNIPAETVAVGGHTSVHFMSESMYLSHGDDPYNALSKAGYPAKLLLITLDEYESWFLLGDFATANKNVGRRPVDLAVQYPSSNAVRFLYCADVQANLDHASGAVYNQIFSPYYPVWYLEEVFLWQRIQEAVNTLGCPTVSQ